MIGFQRIVALIMAAVLVFALLVPMALARHDVLLAAIVIVLFSLYLIVNAWIFVRMRRRV
jgi:hypothetical protein